MSDSNESSLAVVAQQMELDFRFIQRNVRDLSATAQFSNMKELEELHKLAFNNLKEQMAPGKPLSVDPALVLETYRTISSISMRTVEVKCKAADILMKARTLCDVPHPKVGDSGDILENGDVFEEDVSKATLSSGAGIYGNLVDSEEGDPEM